ncbi:MAG: ATP-dependent DNA helicase RecQ [Bacteroidales bacterium]
MKQFWGFDSFRPLQDEVVLSVLDGKDTLALMPTGGGKSLTYQVPALVKDGICLVVSPLIALMKDQVEQLQRRGIKALAIHSGMSRHEISVALDNCVFGGVRLLYLSPERIATELFRVRVQDMNVNLIAVDEAHCISQWGYDFRPSYLQLSNLRSLLPEAPVLALTATATPEVCEDIQDRLEFRSRHLLKQSFERPNLIYEVRKTDDKAGDLLGFLREHPGSGVLYTRSRQKCREIALWLREKGIKAGYYHAGLKQERRDEEQSAWQKGEVRVIVATNAFGMGIDKPDVRFVLHVDLPDHPEAYFQEAGRAGRDGLDARAVLYVGPSDAARALQRIDQGFPDIPFIRKVYAALGNFLQVPVGSGKGQSFDFEFGSFLSRYRFQAMQAHAALSVLEQEGYLTLTEAFHNPTRIMFAVGRDELYRVQVSQGDLDAFVKLLLRTYTGLFSQYVRIDEYTLAKRAGIPVDRIREYLLLLAKRHLIHYIPRKDMPLITYAEERLEEKSLLIAPGPYHFRKSRFEKRLGEMIRYAEGEEHCRSRFLLTYLGQSRAPRCGRCDVCAAGKGDSPGSADDLDEAIRRELTSRSQPVGDLLDRLGGSAPLILEHLEALEALGWVRRDAAMNLIWTGA